MAKPALTKEQLAELYSVSVDSVERWVRTKQIASLKLGRSVRFTEAQIVKFEERRTKKAIL